MAFVRAWYQLWFFHEKKEVMAALLAAHLSDFGS